MTKRVYIGNAEAVAQVEQYDLTGTFGEGSHVRAVCGDKTITVKAAGEVFDATNGPASEDPIDDTEIAMGLLTTLAATINAETIGEFAELTALVECTMGGWAKLTITGALGVPFTVAITAPFPTIDVDTIADAAPGVDEVQSFYFTATPGGGTFTVSWDLGSGVETSSAITYNATAAGVKTGIIGGMATATTNNITVTGTGTSVDPFVVTTSGTLANTALAQLTVSTASLSAVVDAAVVTIQTTSGATANELQAVWVSGMQPVAYNGWTVIRFSNDAGTTWSDWTTQPIQNAASSAQFTQIQTVLDAYLGSGVVVASEHVAKQTPTEESPYYTAVLLWMKFVGTEGHGLLTAEVREDNGMSNVPTVSSERLQAGGSADSNEYQLLLGELTDDEYAGGSPSYSYGTTQLAWGGNNASSVFTIGQAAANLETNLETISGIGSGDVALHKAVHLSGNDLIYVVEFKGALGNTDVATITSAVGTKMQFTVSVLAVGSVGGNEIQRLIITADAGTFTLTFDGAPTTALAWNLSAATLTTALEALAGIGSGDVSITGTGTSADPFYITFQGALAATNVSLLVGDPALLTKANSSSVATVTDGAAGTGESWNVIIHDATGGTFTLGYNGKWTTALTFGDNAATVQAALEALSTVGAGNMGVSGAGTTGSPYVVTGLLTLASDYLYQLQVENELLTGPASITVNNITEEVATGPFFWDNVNNWVDPATGTRAIPVTGDDVFIDWGDSAHCLRYALDQSAVDFNSITVFSSYTDDAYLGNPARHTLEFYEYRELELQVGLQGDKLIRLGYGDGGGAPLVSINSGANETILEVYGSASPVNGERNAVQWRGTHADNIVRVRGGNAGLGVKPGHTTTIKELYISEGNVYLGEDCTVTDLIQKLGGDLVVDKATLTSATLEMVS